MPASERRWIDERTTKLSMAVKLVDAVTGDRPRQEWPSQLGSKPSQDNSQNRPYPRVTLQGIDEEPVKNPSGYSLFLNVDREEITTASIDGGTWYLDQHDVSLPAPSEPPTKDVMLLPSSAYQLSANHSFIYGRLQNADSEPISGAWVRIRDVGKSTTTREDGTYFLRVAGDTVVREGDETESTNVLHIQGEAPSIVVRHDDLPQKSAEVTLPERSAIRYTLTYTSDELIVERGDIS